MKSLLWTNLSWTNLIVRLALGLVMFPHGAQKVFGWYGGPGFIVTLEGFASLGIPPFLTMLVMAAELLGSLGLIVGFLTRIAALGVLSVMVGAVALVHWPQGLLMRCTGTQGVDGFEYHVLAIAMALGLLLEGAGRWSLDRWLAGRMEARRAGAAL